MNSAHWLDPYLAPLASLSQSVSQSPFLLFSLLFLANAVASPYAGYFHDAELYAFQALNRSVDNGYAEDLFFKYGSQDAYSLFSVTVGPLVKYTGNLYWSFFFVFLLGKSVQIWGLQRFVHALMRDSSTILVPLLFLVTTPSYFGGLLMFRFNEPFLTPRLFATGFVLLGLTELLEKRYWCAVIFMVLAFLMHPIMALGGVVLLFLQCCWDFLPSKWFWPTMASLGLLLTCVLVIPSLGKMVFGFMSDEWRNFVMVFVSYVSPFQWTFNDFLLIGLSVVGLAGAAYLNKRFDSRRIVLLSAVIIVGLGGLLCMVIAQVQGYRLLYQAQPSRALWMMQIMTIPAFLSILQSLWNDRSSLAYWIVIMFVLLFDTTIVRGRAIALALPIFLFLAVFCRGLGKQPNKPHWFQFSVGSSILVSLAFWHGFTLYVVLSKWSNFITPDDASFLVTLTFALFGSIPLLIFLVLGLLWLQRKNYIGNCLATAALLLGLLIQLSVAYIVNTPWFESLINPSYQNRRYVQEYLDEHTQKRNELSIYWPEHKISPIWLRLNVKSFYHDVQVAGTLFNEKTAKEGWRRWELTYPFVMEKVKDAWVFTSIRLKDQWDYAERKGLDLHKATVDDLMTLAREPELDYIIIPQKFPDLYSATNGKIYIYDCHKLRAQMSKNP